MGEKILGVAIISLWLLVIVASIILLGSDDDEDNMDNFA
jgi:hypothetical protein